MNIKSQLCLSGYGYLEDIYAIKEGKLLAKLKVVTSPCAESLSEQDDIRIDCEFGGSHHQMKLIHLFAMVKQGKSVIVAFKVEYSEFGAVYSTQAGSLVVLQCKLILLDGCYVNGQDINVNDVKFLAVA